LNKRNVGTRGESMAAAYLKGLGYEILCCNYRNRFGEIDLVARDGSVLCFVEVKYRSSLAAGSPTEAVGMQKQRQITKTAMYYLMKEEPELDPECRFDVVSITGDELVLYKNAFEAVYSNR